MITNSVKKILVDFERWRESQGKTQREISEELGITRTHYNKVVNDRTAPSLQLLDRMEKMMNRER